jgi:cell division protein FtsQ
VVLALVVVAYDFTFNRKAGVSDLVNKLVITGHKKLTKEELIDIMGMKPGVSFDNYKLETLEEKLKKHPRIKDASVSRRSREQLLVSIAEKKAKFIINSNDTLYEIDEDFQVMSIDEVREPNLTIISGDFKIGSNKLLGANLKDFTKTVAYAWKLYPQLKERVSEVAIGPDGGITVYVHHPHRFKVFLGNSMDILQIRKLYAALAYFENQNTVVRLLDLRGDDAVFH